MSDPNQDLLLQIMHDCVRDCEVALLHYIALQATRFWSKAENSNRLKKSESLEDASCRFIKECAEKAGIVLKNVKNQVNEHFALKKWLIAKFALIERRQKINDQTSLALDEKLQNYKQDITKLSQKLVFVNTQIHNTHNTHTTNALSTNGVVDNGICLVFEKVSNLLQMNAVVCDRMLKLKILNNTNTSRTIFDCVSFKLKRLNIWSCKVVYLLCLIIRFRVNRVLMHCEVPSDCLNRCCQSNIILRYFPHDGGGILSQWLPDFAAVLRF